ncbi:MAG: hypothetical protein ACE5FD_12850 [Anaerolineae bacterium]
MGSGVNSKILPQLSFNGLQIVCKLTAKFDASKLRKLCNPIQPSTGNLLALISNDFYAAAGGSACLGTTCRIKLIQDKE